LYTGCQGDVLMVLEEIRRQEIVKAREKRLLRNRIEHAEQVLKVPWVYVYQNPR